MAECPNCCPCCQKADELEREEGMADRDAALAHAREFLRWLYAESWGSPEFNRCDAEEQQLADVLMGFAVAPPPEPEAAGGCGEPFRYREGVCGTDQLCSRCSSRGRGGG